MIIVIIVDTYRSCKMLITSLKNNVVIDNMYIHIFQIKVDFVILADFSVLNSPVASPPFYIPVTGQV